MRAAFEFRHYGQGVRIFEYCTILCRAQISLCDHARIDARVRLEGGQGLTIGERVHIGSGSALNVGGGELVFGAHSGCSINVVIATGQPDLSYRLISAAEEPDDCHVIKQRTIIGQYVVIFAGAVICPGVTIGDGAIVAAGAVVTCDIPSGEIWGGVPARFIKRREVTR
jgi:acetyltransferase-like isoleucine patch superfamily enzyme